MHRATFQYRLYPTKAQETTLQQTLDECRWLYNHLLAERTQAWEERRASLSLHEQITTLPHLKRDRPSLAAVHSQVLQNVAVRLDLAFKTFFRRVQAEEEPGYPRFRGRGRYDSFCYPQSGFALRGTAVRLSKIGVVRLVLHRPIEGAIKTCCMRRSSTGKWFVAFACEVPDQAVLAAPEEAVGIDVGLASFATLSTGEQIANPRFFRRDEQDLARKQRRLAQAAKGTRARRQRRKVVARVHERIANRRRNFAHQQARRIVNRFQVIAVEDLAVHSMVHNHCLAKSISDAAWVQFRTYLAYKAAWAGRQFVAVNPAHTSQECSSCGHRQKLALCERTYRCPRCGSVLDRDQNASLNILRLGRQSLGAMP
jgi:putative transposase